MLPSSEVSLVTAPIFSAQPLISSSEQFSNLYCESVFFYSSPLGIPHHCVFTFSFSFFFFPLLITAASPRLCRAHLRRRCSYTQRGSYQRGFGPDPRVI